MGNLPLESKSEDENNSEGMSSKNSEMKDEVTNKSFCVSFFADNTIQSISFLLLRKVFLIQINNEGNAHLNFICHCARDVVAVVYSEKNDNYGNVFKKPMVFTNYLTRLSPMEKNRNYYHHEYDGIRELDKKIPPWFIFFSTALLLGYSLYVCLSCFNDGQVQ